MMSENPGSQDNLADEIRKLGKNLGEFFQSAWDSQERRKVQSELEASLVELSATLRSAADDFSQSDTGKQIKADVQDIHQRMETGELQQKIRTDLLDALHRVNDELKGATEKWTPDSTTTSDSADDKKQD